MAFLHSGVEITMQDLEIPDMMISFSENCGVSFTTIFYYYCCSHSLLLRLLLYSSAVVCLCGYLCAALLSAAAVCRVSIDFLCSIDFCV
jgi:hypothetical protein